jgi:Vitamin K-dependent gamma-carboxylase
VRVALGESVARFALQPASARPLAVLRIGIATVLIAEAAVIAAHLHEYYGPLGLVQSPLSEALVHSSLPSLRVAARVLSVVGIGEGATIQIAFAFYVIALHLLLIGYHTRIAALTSWLLFLAFKRAGSTSAYGAFEFAQIALFYCVVLPVGAATSIDALRNPKLPSSAARIGLRLLQLHLCVVYFASGVEKSLGAQWWNGEAIWRALMRPHSAWIDFSWLPEHAWLAKSVCWATLACEMGYAIFVWIERSRHLWVTAVIALHIAIAVSLGLLFFSAVMIVLNVSAFLLNPEPAEATAHQLCAGITRNSREPVRSGTVGPSAGYPIEGPS